MFCCFLQAVWGGSLSGADSTVRAAVRQLTEEQRLQLIQALLLGEQEGDQQVEQQRAYPPYGNTCRKSALYRLILPFLYHFTYIVEF